MRCSLIPRNSLPMKNFCHCILMSALSKCISARGFDRTNSKKASSGTILETIPRYDIAITDFSTPTRIPCASFCYTLCTMHHPIILVPSSLQANPDQPKRLYVNQSYASSIERSGGTPWIIARPSNEETIRHMLEMSDGLHW